jgi:hypothetical protein
MLTYREGDGMSNFNSSISEAFKNSLKSSKDFAIDILDTSIDNF